MNPRDKETLASMVQLDENQEIDKHIIEREIDRRKAYFIVQDQDQQKGALLLLQFVKAVERGYYPEKEVLKKVSERFRTVLEETTYHLSPSPPEHWWTETPHTEARETGKVFVESFGMNKRRSNPKTHAATEELKLLVWDYLANSDNPEAVSKKEMFGDIAKETRKIKVKERAEFLYRSLQSNGSISDEKRTDGMASYTSCLKEAEAAVPDVTAKDITALQNLYNENKDPEGYEIHLSWKSVLDGSNPRTNKDDSDKGID